MYKLVRQSKSHNPGVATGHRLFFIHWLSLESEDAASFILALDARSMQPTWADNPVGWLALLLLVLATTVYTNHDRSPFSMT